MPQLKQFLLPDVGEGLTEGEIVAWMVQPGDTVTDGQPIVEVETAKVTVELPCPYDGVVAELHAARGDTVDVGAPLITVAVGADGEAPASVDGLPVAGAVADPADAGGPGSTPAAAQDAMVPKLPVPDPPVPDPPAPESPTNDVGTDAMLVGYGPRAGAATRRPRRRPDDGVNLAAVAASPAANTPAVLAKPPIRKLAKDLGVDLTTVIGTGPGGVITRADLETAAAPAPPAAAGTTYQHECAPATGADREHRVPVKGVRKHTAAAMVRSAFTAPHVTEFLTIDITPSMAVRRRITALPEFAGVKVSPLLLVARALLVACARHPMINSSWDDDSAEIVVKDYVNLGIAAATDRGLIVPNIKDAGRLSLRQLAGELADVTESARAGSTTAADLAGGTISISNVGVFGIDTGTPILPPGETAILAFGAVREMPWVVDGQIVARQVTQLALSFDHRVVDGQLGSLFLADIGAMLSDPAVALAWS